MIKVKALFDRVSFSISEPYGDSLSMYITPEVIRTVETNIYRKKFGKLPKDDEEKFHYKMFAKYPVTSDLQFHILYYKKKAYMPDKMITFYSSMHNCFDYKMISVILNSLIINHSYSISLSSLEVTFDFEKNNEIDFEFLRKSLWTSSSKVFNVWKEDGIKITSDMPPDSDSGILYTNYHGPRNGPKQTRLYQKSETGKDVNRFELVMKSTYLKNYKVDSVDCLKNDLSWIFELIGFYRLDHKRWEKKYGSIKDWLHKGHKKYSLKEFFEYCKGHFEMNIPNMTRYLIPLTDINDAMKLSLQKFQEEFNGGPVLPFPGKLPKKRRRKAKVKRPRFPRKRKR